MRRELFDHARGEGLVHDHALAAVLVAVHGQQRLLADDRIDRGDPPDVVRPTVGRVEVRVAINRPYVFVAGDDPGTVNEQRVIELLQIARFVVPQVGVLVQR